MHAPRELMAYSPRQSRALFLKILCVLQSIPASIKTAPLAPKSMTDKSLNSPELRLSLLNFVRARVHDFHAAEDLTQVILMRAVSSRAYLKSDERLEAWLFRIARNVICDHYRKPARTTSLDDKEYLTGVVENGHLDEEDALLRERLAAYVRGVVEGLPLLYRDALRFTDYEGRSQVQLAESAGITVSAAKSRVQRARKEVQKIIEACCHVETDRYGDVVEMRKREPSGNNSTKSA
ncbi:hypothetical protein DB346_23305 [Verrucomicrobia bacterium LW23]|nr:hypothetical protein DB346_23305 [Verrucomicrobia bacterium LW23]